MLNPKQYVHAVVFDAPIVPSEQYIKSLPFPVKKVYHGSTSYMRMQSDPYTDAKALGLFEQIPSHNFQNVDAAQIVSRILSSKAEFEERQRKKGAKAVNEAAAEALERQQQQQQQSNGQA